MNTSSFSAWLVMSGLPLEWKRPSQAGGTSVRIEHMEANPTQASPSVGTPWVPAQGSWGRFDSGKVTWGSTNGWFLVPSSEWRIGTPILQARHPFVQCFVVSSFWRWNDMDGLGLQPFLREGCRSQLTGNGVVVVAVPVDGRSCGGRGFKLRRWTRVVSIRC